MSSNRKIYSKELDNLNQFFTKNSAKTGKDLKKIICRENLIEYKCSICGNPGIWNEKVLSL